MATTLQYGTVTLSNVLTKKFEQEAIYDDSGTDLLYHKFTVRVVGYIHNAILDTVEKAASVDVQPRNDNRPALDYGRIRAALLEPRKVLLMTVGGDTLLYCSPAGVQAPVGLDAWKDVNNGPKPRQCEVTEIVGASLLKIEYTIEANVLECASNANASNVLNNRFSIADDIDEDWYTTRTYRGKIKLKDVVYNAHAFRHWVIPPLQRGFKRTKVEVASSVDGLSLEYVVTDKEIYAACPFPGTTWEGTHTVTTGEHAVTTISELVISMTGPRTVPKRDLIATCALIAFKKLDLTVELRNTYMLLGASFVDYLHDNRVEMRARIQHTPGKDQSMQPLLHLSLAMKKIGEPLNLAQGPAQLVDYNPELSPVPPYFGTATWTGLFVCALQSPCNANHGMPQFVDAPPEKPKDKPDSGDGEVLVYEPGTGLAGIGDPEVERNISQDTLQAMYTHYSVDVDYRADSLRVQLPIANAPAVASGPTCVVLSLGRSQANATVRVAAERVGDWPNMPAAGDFTDGNGVKWSYRDARVVAKTPTLTADKKTRLFSLDGEIRFFLSRPLAGNESLLTGRLPFDTFSDSQNRLPIDKLSILLA